MLCRLLPVVLTGALSLAAASEADPPSTLVGLPKLPKPTTATAQALGELTTMAPGIRIAASGVVVLDGRIAIDQGPVDGLEVLACLEGGKNHETVITLDTGAAEFVAAACKGALGAPDGQPVDPGQRFPARGTPMRVSVQWDDAEHPGTTVETAGSSLIRDRVTDQSYPALPFVYTGSRFLAIPMSGPDGKTVTREQFMLSSTRSVAVIFDEPDALLASPCPEAWRDHHYEVNSGICPPRGTKVRVVLTRATLPLTLDLDAKDQLTTRGATLDDANLITVLAKHFGPGTNPALRAVAISVDAKQAHSSDLAARTRILSAAGRAQAWVVPVFVPR